MIAGIIGDIIGSVYEAHQWANKDISLIQSLPFDKAIIKPLLKEAKWVREDYSWTDDTLCTLALYKAFYTNSSPVSTMVELCKKYQNETIGFGRSFEKWLDNPVPYQSYGNGAVMRIGFIPYLPISLEDKISLAYDYTKISHDHEDCYNAVNEFIILSEKLKLDKINDNYKKECIKEILNKYKYEQSVESLHNEFKFEINALQTFLQAIVIVLEGDSFEDILRNSFYVGGDSDTLACIACNIGSMLYEVPEYMITLAKEKLEPYEDLTLILNHFEKSP